MAAPAVISIAATQIAAPSRSEGRRVATPIVLAEARARARARCARRTASPTRAKSLITIDRHWIRSPTANGDTSREVALHRPRTESPRSANEYAK